MADSYGERSMSWLSPHVPVSLLASTCRTSTNIVPVLLLVSSALCQEPAGEKADVARFPIMSGVGLALRALDGSLYVGKVIPDSVAERSKAIGEGDRLLAIHIGERHISVEGKPLGEVVSLIRGPVGSKVTLQIQQKNQDSSIEVPLVREPIRLEGIGVTTTTYESFIGKMAPELKFATVDGLVPVELAGFRGKVVVLDFWATWCPTCYQPVEDLQEIARSHPEWNDRVVFLTASVDTDRERANRVIKERAWTRTTNLSIDPAELNSAGIRVLPVLLVLSQNGRIAALGESHAIDVQEEVRALLSSAVP